MRRVRFGREVEVIPAMVLLPMVDLNEGFYIERLRRPVTRQRAAESSPLLPMLVHRGRMI